MKNRQMNFVKYQIKKIGSTLFFYLGGLLLVKKLLKKEATLIVFNYHNFSKYNNYKYKRGNILETGFERNFEKQLLFFKKHFNLCYPNEFFLNPSSEKPSLLLTFDDGYKDNYDIAFPLLRKHEFCAIFFVSTKPIIENDFLFHDKLRFLICFGILNENFEDLLSRLNRGENGINENDLKMVENLFIKHRPNCRLMMSPQELKEISENGLILGNHTHAHANLKFLQKENQQLELKMSNLILKEISNKEVNAIAYPNGLYNNETLKLIKKMDNGCIRFGFTTNLGTNKQTTHLHQLNRIGVNVSDSIQIIMLKIFMSLLKINN